LALDLATRIVVEVPKMAESSGAEAIRKRALERLGARAAGRGPLTATQRIQQARAWLESGDAERAASLARAIEREAVSRKDGAIRCAASTLRAQALAHTKGGVGSAWDDAIVGCEGDPGLVTALYSGAKAAAAKHPDVARARYARVEQLFHEHRLADDARFQGALLALAGGDEATFTTMMLSLPDDYPSGDQRAEALFRVALTRMAHGDWTHVAPLLDRIVELNPDDQHWATAGRAEYFRARAAYESGDHDDARRRYAAVVDRHPFAYYMAEAYDRLSEDDPSLATGAISAAIRKESDEPFSAGTHPELASAAFARALALLEVGDIDLARREFAGAGATRDGVAPEVLWTVALLYDQAGAPDVGHAFARQRLKDYLAHYPVGAWRTKWEIAYPRAFDELVGADSATNRIPRALAWAIMREESDFVPEAKSASSAYGLMQLIVPTAKAVARGLGLPSDESALRQPSVNVALGTRLLAELRGSFADNPALAIAAYNGGSGAVNRWLAARGDGPFDLWVEQIPWEETRGYEKRVLSSEAAYAYLYDPAALDEVLRLPRRARGASSAASTR
jgi:soluble lytic murein transglycosylase